MIPPESEPNSTLQNRPPGSGAGSTAQPRPAYTTPLRPLEESNLTYLANRAELINEVERQARELRLLHEIRRSLIGVNSLQAIYKTAVENISSIFDFPLVSIYQLIGNQLQMQAQVGYAEFFQAIPVGRGVNGQVAATGRGVLLADVRRYSNYLQASPDVTSSICVPLLGPGQEVLGTLSIETDATRQLDERDYRLSQALAEHVSLALAQALGHEREKRRFAQLALLNHVGRDLAAALEVDDIIERVTGPVRQGLGLYIVSIGMVEEADLVFRRVPIRQGRDLGENRDYRWPLDTNSLACHSVRTGELVVCHDVTSEPRYLFLPETPDTKSEVVLPLRSGGQIIGVLDVESDASRTFDDDDIILLKTLADQTSVALTNARRFADLQRQSQELNATNKALAEANRLKSEFLANVSHELRTPLNSIIGYVDMIQTGFYGDVPGEMNDPLERVHRNGRRLMVLINDVLDLANIEAGRLQLLIEEVLTAELLPALSLFGKAGAEEKGLNFQAILAPGTPRLIYTDIKRLQQVVGILLSNAIKFTKQGQVSLTLAPAPAPLQTYPNQPAYCISISDTGIGIAGSEFEHIFEEFRQVDGSSTRQFGGTGLGLALARRLVQQMSGRLSVSSELGQGTTFTITLPVNPKG